MTRLLTKVLLVVCLGYAAGPHALAHGDKSGATAITTFKVDRVSVTQGTDGGMVGWGYDLGEPWRDGVAKGVDAGFRLQRTQISLARFRDRPLDDLYLQTLSSGFDMVRELGAKVIVRFMYSNPEVRQDVHGGENPDAPLAMVLRHIEQLGPVLERQHDVIAWFEAGFIGAWGEWHSSSNGLVATPARDAIKEALLKHFPRSRQILFRNPSDVRRWYPAGRSPGDDIRLLAGEALSDDQDRIGIHNDCFLSTATDGNTYPLRSLRDFTKRWNRATAFGGETCEFPPWRMRCADIESEGAAYSLAYLNGAGGNAQFEDRWRQQGCLDTIRASIGPRIELLKLEHPAKAVRQGRLDLVIAMRNGGWSRIPNRRQLYLVLASAEDGASHRLPLAIDSDDWLPQSATGPDATATRTVEMTLPASIRPGRYRVALASPDPSSRLAADPRYALRFANRDVAVESQRWDPANGHFLTGTDLIVEPGP